MNTQSPEPAKSTSPITVTVYERTVRFWVCPICDEHNRTTVDATKKLGNPLPTCLCGVKAKVGEVVRL